MAVNSKIGFCEKKSFAPNNNKLLISTWLIIFIIVWILPSQASAESETSLISASLVYDDIWRVELEYHHPFASSYRWVKDGEAIHFNAPPPGIRFPDGSLSNKIQINVSVEFNNSQWKTIPINNGLTLSPSNNLTLHIFQVDTEGLARYIISLNDSISSKSFCLSCSWSCDGESGIAEGNECSTPEGTPTTITPVSTSATTLIEFSGSENSEGIIGGATVAAAAVLCIVVVIACICIQQCIKKRKNKRKFSTGVQCTQNDDKDLSKAQLVNTSHRLVKNNGNLQVTKAQILITEEETESQADESRTSPDTTVVDNSEFTSDAAFAPPSEETDLPPEEIRKPLQTPAQESEPKKYSVPKSQADRNGKDMNDDELPSMNLDFPALFSQVDDRDEDVAEAICIVLEKEA